jgi:hypothetical protein
MNGIRDPNKIRAGAKIFIPGQGPNKASVMYNSGRSTPKPVQARHEMSSWGGNSGMSRQDRFARDANYGLAMGTLDGMSALTGVGFAARAPRMAASQPRATYMEGIPYSHMRPNVRRSEPDIYPSALRPTPRNSSDQLMALGTGEPALMQVIGRGVPRYGGMSRRGPDISSVSPKNYTGQARTITDLERMLYGGGY